MKSGNHLKETIECEGIANAEGRQQRVNICYELQWIKIRVEGLTTKSA